jgi:hypothetical protein
MSLVMTRRRFRRTSGGGAALLACALVAVSLTLTSAYASSATGPHGGEGSSGISGYTVSNVHFAPGTGGTVAGVGFRLMPAGARTVHIRLATAGPWLVCTVSGSNAACPVPAGTGTAGLDQLSVVAY